MSDVSSQPGAGQPVSSGLKTTRATSRTTSAAAQSAEKSATVMATAYRDRATPAWAAFISVLFSMGAGVCLLATAVFIAFFYDQVALNQQSILAPLLFAGALVPIIGILIFDVGHARALAGYRYMRLRHAALGRAVVGLLAGTVLAMLDLRLVLPFVLGGALAWGLSRLADRGLPGEPLWAFVPQEAVSFLSGRDQRAVDMANAARGESPLFTALCRALGLSTLIGALALASWLTAQDVLDLSAVATVALITAWSVQAFIAVFRQNTRHDPENTHRAVEVVSLPAPYVSEDAETDTALIVSHLSVRAPDGRLLLTDVSFQAEPGAIIGICGDSFSAKSLLMRALHAPHDMTGLSVRGHVALHGTPLWERHAHERQLSSVFVPPELLSVPGGGANNLTCFADEAQVTRARRVLQSLVFTADTVNRIETTTDVTHLSRTEQKALSLARALALRPQLYLFDRPEDGANETLMTALSDRIRAESRLGHISLIITENRRLLEACDHLLMMQNGRVIEFAPTAEIRARQSSGWNRFVCPRDLDQEEALDGWVCSQFRRDGDEANRRAVCMVANEMLSVACQTAPGPEYAADQLSFEFKHFAGHCQLKMIDTRLALSSGAMQKARAAAQTSVEGERLSPLAKITRDCLEVETGATQGDGHLLVTIKTYDPRLLSGRKVDSDATPQA
ncbi:ABC transporter ATP-binding protein [Shimia sp. R11_0]|uniref:ATP-binding cassette domain-containing protein n=1 Tax=Shimia sp. R11_0 TaxID=2821096 RepID=UPI001ADD1C4F|nr:ATP-binding cassette domain-containing protein [Shimia sp. R11_0]MBO9478207.1 ABC transporter ATP-binding protein [Shimia sp. R11_0]